MITHEEQRRIWEEEHRQPLILTAMDAEHASFGIMLFLDWLKERMLPIPENGMEICCGKGRNCHELARRGIRMTGIDFSMTAIETATARAERMGLADRTTFVQGDATSTWPIADGSCAIAIDCFGLTDIESVAGRRAARNECVRVLKPGGLLLAYASSTDCAYHGALIAQSPGTNRTRSFIRARENSRSPIRAKPSRPSTNCSCPWMYG